MRWSTPATKSLAGAISEATRPQARLRIYPGGRHLAFPNKCRHCDPAPCQEVCIAGAIRRDAARGTVDIDPQRCISCAMCAMACPFGVLTYAPVHAAPDKLAVALKCDQCPDRERLGQVPACVAACKVGALTYGDWPDGPGRQRPVSSPGLLCDAPGGGRRQRHPALIRLWRQLG